MFWKKGDTGRAPAGAKAATPTTATPIDPAIEEKRIQSLTGGKTIVIARKGDPVKLPGP